MRALVLFSGTDSVGRWLRGQGWETVTLDWDPKARADICENLHDWDHTAYPPGYFQFVQASPDCTEYSMAMTCRPRDLEKADKLVQRTLEIVAHFQAPFWMENPGGAALLHKRPFMEQWNAFRTEVPYCLYNDFPYRKLTSCWVARPLADGSWEKVVFPTRGKCPHKKHISTAQRSTKDGRHQHTQQELFKIPPDLIADIVHAACPSPGA